MKPEQLVAECFVKWAEMKRAECGDSFATSKEMESIKSDPLGSLELLRCVDAYQFALLVLQWN